MTEKVKKFMAFTFVSLLVLSFFSGLGYGMGTPEKTGNDLDIRILVQKRGVDLEGSYGNSDYEVIEDYDSYLLMDTSEEGKESLESQDVTIEVLHNRGHVGLQSYSFDTKEGTPDIPENVEIEGYSEEETGYYIVQFIGPIRPEWRDELEKEGAELQEFRHRFNFIVEMDLETKRRMEQNDFVNWIGTYQPAYRFDRELLEDFDEKVIDVSFFDGVDLSESARKIESLGGEIETIVRNRITAKIHTQRIERVANLKGVNSITEGTEEYELYNADATWITQTNEEGYRNVTEAGITGEGEIITVMDSELYGGNSDYEDHEMWNDTEGNPVGDDHRKIQAHYVPGDANGDLNNGVYHGTHVTGTVLGDADPYGEYTYYDGNALEARLIFQDINDGSDDSVYPPSDMYNDGYGKPYEEWGSKIHTNSWGSGSGYGDDAITADQFIWDHKDYNILYAMGNDGTEPNTLSEQPEGKNVLSIGSVTNAPDHDDVSSFSSRGYADDGRIKPTVMHVGENLWSADQSYDGYHSMSGTSMSTPGIAGQVGQVRQYYEDGWYLNGTSNESAGFNPSNALVRATLINGAVEISGTGAYENDERFPNNDQGYGRSKLDRVLHFDGDERNLIVNDSWNENQALDTGENWTMEFNVDDPDQELEVTLAWSDYPGSDGSDSNDPA
ncbi:MAG: S8 family serine peptidase, partial [Candidatus Natronoplasma sp.]